MRRRVGTFLVVQLQMITQVRLNLAYWLTLVPVFASFVLVPALTGCRSSAPPEPEQVLHVVAEEKIKGLDPIYSDDLYSSTQSSQAYETLLQYHYLKRPYQLIPLLAEKMPEVSRDGLVYTFHLKAGVFFHDDPCFKSSSGKGRELTAEDLIYSFKRLADPRLASPGWWILEGKIQGLNEWREAVRGQSSTDYSLPVEGLRALDPKTLQIRLTKRSAQFLYGLSMPYAAVVPHEAVEYYGKEFINHAVGTGPFLLKQYSPNSKLVWDRNPQYRRELYPSDGSKEDQQAGLLQDAGHTLPIVERVVVHVMIERQPMWLNFLAGHLDYAGIPKDSFSQAINSQRELSPEMAARGMKLVKTAALDVTHLTFNMADPLLGNNRLLRRAISLAFDESTYIELFLNGRAIPAQGPIPPGIDGYDPELQNPYRKFDLLQAKKLMVQAGYPEGKGLPPLEYATLADSAARQQAEYFQKMLSPLGIQLSVNAYSWPQFQETIKTKKAQMWGYAWQVDYPDAENLFQLFYSKNESPGPNDANYKNPRFDRLFEESLALPQGEQRSRLYRQMVALLIEDCPWIFGSHRLSYVLLQPWLKNYKPNDFDHSRYKYLRIDPALKKRGRR
ncbi:MAG: ABC transporter substrate-binding protein [Bdellovibrionia bacterium]